MGGTFLQSKACIDVRSITSTATAAPANFGRARVFLPGDPEHSYLRKSFCNAMRGEEAGRGESARSASESARPWQTQRSGQFRKVGKSKFPDRYRRDVRHAPTGGPAGSARWAAP